MEPRKNNAPGRWSDSGAGKAITESSIADLSEASKALAILWYNTGARSRAQTDEGFRAHPCWGAA